MKMIIVAALSLLACVAALPVESEPPKILKSEFDQKPEGPYTYSFETENGITYNEQGELKEVTDEDNKPHNVIVVKGSYSYTGPDGKPVSIQFYADETGYHAEGDSIPKVPARK